MTDYVGNGRSFRGYRYVIGAVGIGLFMLTAVCMVCLDADYSYASDHGTFGNGLEWSFDGNHTLTITGTGDMPDYGQDRPPWEIYKDQITTVTIGEGITKIGEYTFSNYGNIVNVGIPSTLKTIGRQAFDRCSSLQSIDLVEGITYIGTAAFFGCSSLTVIVIPKTVYSVYGGTFQECSSVREITIPNTVGEISGMSFYGTLYGPWGEYLDPTPFQLDGHVFKGDDPRYLYMAQYGFMLYLNGGKSYQSYVFGIPGEPADVKDPTKEGYAFAGWYSDESLTTPYTVTTYPDTDTPINIYAKWVPAVGISSDDTGNDDDEGSETFVIALAISAIVLSIGLLVAFGRK